MKRENACQVVIVSDCDVEFRCSGEKCFYKEHRQAFFFGLPANNECKHIIVDLKKCNDLCNDKNAIINALKKSLIEARSL